MSVKSLPIVKKITKKIDNINSDLVAYAKQRETVILSNNYPY